MFRKKYTINIAENKFTNNMKNILYKKNLVKRDSLHKNTGPCAYRITGSVRPCVKLKCHNETATMISRWDRNQLRRVCTEGRYNLQAVLRLRIHNRRYGIQSPSCLLSPV